MDRRKNHSQPFVRLFLETLEDRVLLNASSGEQAAFAIIGDLLQTRTDMEISPLTIVNSAQLTQTHTTPLAALESWWLKSWSVLTTDFNQALQDVVRFKDAALQMFLQDDRTLFNVLGSYLAGFFQSSESPAANSSEVGEPFGSRIIVSPRQGPAIGDPAISAIEGDNWGGIVAVISDNDGDGTQGQPEIVNGTINWGDGNSTPFGLQLPEIGSNNLVANHTWMEPGNYTVTITVNDPDSGQSQISETASVTDGQLSWYQGNAAPNQPPTWTQNFDMAPSVNMPTSQVTIEGSSISLPIQASNFDGDNVSLQLTASDANNATISYSATGLPPGLTIGTSTGLISGTISRTADTNSPYSVNVTAKDSNNDSVSQTFNWTVARVAMNPVNDQENQEGTSVSLQLSATDNEGTPTYSATGLPPGLSISSAGLISGTVGIGSFGSSPYQVTATATDGTATSNQSFIWTVTPRVALVNPGPQSNATGDSVSLQLSATSPRAP